MKLQSAQNNQNNLEKKKVGGKCSNFTTYSKTVVIEQCCCGIRTDIKMKGIEIRAQK